MSTVSVHLTEDERVAAVRALRNMLAEFGGISDWPEAKSALQKLRCAEPASEERAR